MRICLTLAMLCALSGCVTQEVGPDGRVITRKLDDQLVVDDDGRIVGRPTRLKAPATVIINGGTPTEREIRLLGVEGLPESEAPISFNKIKSWMKEHVAEEPEIFVKPALETNLDNEVIYGIVYLYARENQDDPRSPIVAGAYVSMNQALLSLGLLRIRNIEEFDDAATRKQMQRTEDQARKNRSGIWSSNP